LASTLNLTNTTTATDFWGQMKIRAYFHLAPFNYNK
jgi:hypothetical protein